MLKAAKVMAATASVWAAIIFKEIAAMAADAEAPSCGGFGGGGPSAGAEGGGMGSLLFPLAIFIVIFYFFIIRPQKKRQKQQDNLITSITKGDQVITIGGFFGTVQEVREDSFIIELAKDVRVRILRTAVATKREASAPTAVVDKL